jgi:hypothetical protein
MRLSHDAYDDTIGEDKETDEPGTLQRFSCPDVGVYGTVRRLRSGAIALAFSGTRGLNIAQWMTNARTAFTEFYDDGEELGRTSDGVTTAWVSVMDEVFRIFGDFDLGLKPSIVITGHSLGGALAQVAAGSIMRGFPMLDVHVCTFGAPRCCDQTFADALRGRVEVVCFENFHDMVPRLPVGDEYTSAATKTPIVISMCGIDDLDGETDTDSYWDILGEIVHTDCPINGEDSSDDDGVGGCEYDTPADLLREHSMAHYIMTIKHERLELSRAAHTKAREDMPSGEDKKGKKWYGGCVIA